MQQVDELVRRLEGVDNPKIRADIQELVATLMELHREGLSRFLALVASKGEASPGILDAATSDTVINTLLLLHDLHPVDLEIRVARALDGVRPLLRSHGGDVSLIAVENGMVRLRLEGSCHGCAGSTVTLKTAIEEALYGAAPDISGLAVEGVVGGEPQPDFVPVETLGGCGRA